MSARTIIANVKALVAPIIEAQQLELVDVEFRQEGPAKMLRIFIDKPGGVSLDDCQNVSRECETLLDVENIIQSQYVFEVSSPGLDRPLKSLQDYARFQERLVKIKTHEAIQGRKHFLGRLRGVREDADATAIVTIALDENEEIVEIPYSQISSARLEVEF